MSWVGYVVATALLDAATDVTADHVIESDNSSDSEDEITAADLLESCLDMDMSLCSSPGKPQKRSNASKRRLRPAPCSDSTDQHGHPVERLHDTLTSEQDLLCSCIAMLLVSLVLWRNSDWSIMPPPGFGAMLRGGSSSSSDADLALEAESGVKPVSHHAHAAYALCVCAGVLYALGMRAIMKAWEKVPSTVVVPVLQLSGPLVEIIEASLGAVARRRPIEQAGLLLPVRKSSLHKLDAVAFLLITIGGLAPSTESLPQLLQLATWRQPAMTLLLISNVLYSLYYVALSLCVGADPKNRFEHSMDETQFVVISNLVSVFTLVVLFAVTPELRRHARGLRKCSFVPIALSGIAELTNFASMLMISFAYRRHYSSGLVTAARTGLNQFTNVLLATFLYKLAKIGRPVRNLKKKILAACVVSVGLALSLDN